MAKVSIIILSKNEEAVIRDAVSSALKVTDDVIVADSGSTDGTREIVREMGARLLELNWRGFGGTRNHAVSQAKNDFVFCLDADEVITEELSEAIRSMKEDSRYIYGCKRRNFIGGQEIKHGEWGDDTVYRLYDRRVAAWSLADVHESVISKAAKRNKISGALLHFTTDNIHAYREKLDGYAKLSAQKFFKQRKPAGALRANVSPVFGFIKNYIFKLGFLDGFKGLQLAAAHAHYTRRKYKYLLRLNAQKTL